MKKHLVLGLVGLSLSLAAMAAEPKPSLLTPPDLPLTVAEKQQLGLAALPDAAFIAKLRMPQERVDGNLLNPKVQYILEMARASHDPKAAAAELAAFTTAEGRAVIRPAVDRHWIMRTSLSAEMVAVEDRQIDGRQGHRIPVRVYRPQMTEPGPLPVLVYYHGGGFIFSSIAAVDRVVRLIANEARMIVVSVDYRLAPEHPFPAAHDDAEDAFAWTLAQAASLGGDPARVAVGGDSAGGHLAAVTALRRVRAGLPAPALQMLYYPAVTLQPGEGSYRRFGDGYGLDIPFMEAVGAMTFPDPATRTLPDASPLEAPSLKGLPPAIIVTAGYDPLRDQARRYADRLRQEQVAVTYLNYGGLTHSFLNWSGVIGEADRAARQTAALLGQSIRSLTPPL